MITLINPVSRKLCEKYSPPKVAADEKYMFYQWLMSCWQDVMFVSPSFRNNSSARFYLFAEPTFNYIAYRTVDDLATHGENWVRGSA